jgi:hypothetical protein
MSKTSSRFAQFAADLVRIADEIELARRQETDPEALDYRVTRAAITAARQVIDAVAAGADLLGPLAPGRGPVKAPHSDGALLNYWRFFVAPWLRARVPPRAFMAGAGDHDFPPVKTRPNGRMLQREDGSLTNTRLLRRKDGTAARVTDDDGANKRLSRLQLAALDSADACRAAACLLREDPLPEPAGGNTGLRPCYDRDHTWLRWKEEEGMRPAGIRDLWNRDHPEDPVASGESGRLVVKEGIRKAEAEQGKAKRKK